MLLLSKPFMIKSPLAMADSTVMVSLDSRLNPEYLLPFLSFGADTSMISFFGTLPASISGMAARDRFVIALLISTYRYKFAMLLPIGTHSFVWMIFPSCTFSFVLSILKSFGLLIVTSIRRLFHLSYIFIWFLLILNFIRYP